MELREALEDPKDKGLFLNDGAFSWAVEDLLFELEHELEEDVYVDEIGIRYIGDDGYIQSPYAFTFTRDA